MPDFHHQNMSRPWSKYIRVRKYNKKRGEPTMATTTPIENYCTATSNFLMNATGFVDGSDLGRMHVTYYVSFSDPIWQAAAP